MVRVGTLPSLLPYTLKPYLSYAVPTEVGKVGNESPSFIEPIAARRDGIKAMFSKQERSSTASPTKTPTASQKWKSETSQSPSKVTDEEAETAEATSHRNKRPKTNKNEDNSKQVSLVLDHHHVS